jgi:hypothetical protein
MAFYKTRFTLSTGKMIMNAQLKECGVLQHLPERNPE